MARPGRSVRGKALAIAAVGAMILAPLTAVVLVEAPAAAAPVASSLVQSAGASGSNATEGSSVAITATLGEPCNAGDTLVAFVTIAQQVDSAGAVAISPHGWTRLYEHAPSGHVAAYHGWFALSGCSGVTTATFTVTAPGNPDGTTGSVVLSEYAGLPSTLVVDYATNAGDGGGDTSGSLTASTPAPAGSLVLAALSLYAPSTVTSTPAGWSSAGTAGGPLPASTWWETGGSGDPSASFTWSPAPAAWEMTMLILSAGPAGGPPNVVQEASEAFQSSASWSVVLPEGVTAGDALVATILSDADRGGAGYVASTVSGGGVTWKQVTGYGTSGGGTAEIWAGFASTGTTGATTITAGLGASADGQMVISEVSGIAGIDATSATSGSGVDPTATSLTPTAGDFLVAAMAAPGATLWIHPGPLWSTFSMSTTPAYGAEWQSSAPAAATAPQWTDFSSAPWVAVVAAFTIVPTTTITAVKSLTSADASGLTTLAVSPETVGDVLVVFARVTSGFTVSSVSGGGVGTWSKAVQFNATSPGAYDEEIWYGKVTTTGSSTITFTWSGSIAGHTAEYGAQEFSAGLGASTVWALDKTGTLNGASSTSVPFPSLTPSTSGEVYFGYSLDAGTATGGSTSGFTYAVTAESNVVTYDTGVSGAVSPAAVQTPAGTSSSVGVLLSASSGAPTPAPAVTGVSPASGSTAGGSTVTITGTNFTGATGVTFGATAATTFKVNSATSITATSPPEPAWQADVTVTTPSGTSATGAADKFTFVAANPVATGTPHVMEIMMENESNTDLIGNAAAPNINHLAQTYGIATESYSIGHPSLPNYLELLSGSNWGVTDDGTPQTENISASVSTIANQLEAAGIPWRAYLESMPSAGYTGGDGGGTDPYGFPYYLQHHNPFVYFPAVTSLADFSTNVVPFTNIDSDLNSGSPPAFVWVSPNAMDDMHDGPEYADLDTVPTFGDAWLAGFVGSIQATSWYAAGGQIVVQWDEGAEADTSGVGTAGEGGGGHTATLVISSALAASPQQDATPVNTAGVLHSVEKVYGFPYLEDAANSGNGNIDSLMASSVAPAPTVTGVSPSTGSTAGGTTVTITGTNFTGASAVKFGTVAATSFTVNSATSITATSPAESASAVDVRVTTTGGTSAVSQPADQFTYSLPPAPTVTGVSPSTGSTAGGTTVTITGTNFTGASAVKFGTVAATSFTVNSATSITATSPAESASAVDVRVTTTGGTSAVSQPADQFTYSVPSTTISAVGTLTSADASGLTTLAVSPKTVGDVLVVFARVTSGFTVSSVSGGGVGTWSKAVQFNATSPGAYDEEIWYGKVTTTGSSTITFTWSGSIAGHTAEYGAQEFSAGLGASTVWALDKTGTLNGASSTSVPFPSLTPSTSGEVYFGYSLDAGTATGGSTSGFTYAVTAESNVVTYDTGVSGAVSPAAVQTPAGTSSSVGVLLSATSGAPPASVISPVGTTVSQTGTGITTLTGVDPLNVGDLLIAVDEQNDNSITATSVSGGGVTTWTRAIQYVGVNEPREYEIWYGVVTSTGSSTITFHLSGSNAGAVAEYEAQEFTAGLGSGATWSLDTTNHQENAASTTVTYPSLTPAGAGELYYGFADMPSPPGGTGTAGFTFFTTADANQTAYNADAGSGAVQPTSAQGAADVSSAVAAFFIVHAPALTPTVTGVSPSSGSTAGGTTVTITGTNFTGASAVTFGATAATSFTVNSASSITATSPAESASAVDVRVTTTGGTSAVSQPADQFTYSLPPAPTVTGVSPASGSTAGGTTVTITGTNFTGASAVTFGATAATSFTVNSATSITATSPAEGASTVDVRVTTTAGTSAVNQPADQFTFSLPPAPTVTGVSPSTGSTAGGTTVTITGTNFTGASAVKFGTVAATSFTVNSATSITATSPAESASAVDVRVTTTGGTSAVSQPADQFTYSVPSTTISAVGTLTSADASGLTTLAVSPKTVGDVLVVFARVTSGFTVSSVSGGGVGTWSKAVQFNATSPGAYDEEIWYGKVTTTGSSTITFTWSGSIAGHTAEYGAQEFSAGLGASTVWALDKTGTLNGASSTSVPFPSLTPSTSGEVYFGYSLDAGTATGGSTSGFTYAVTAESNVVTYDTGVSGAVSPAAVQTPAGTSSSVAILLSASP